MFEAYSTKVITREGEKQHIHIMPGQEVWSYNEQLMENEFRKVKFKKVNTATNYYLVNGRLKVTAEQLFMCNGSWLSITHIPEGEFVKTFVGTEKIRNIQFITKIKEVVEVLKIDGNGSYYANGFLVKSPESALGT